MNKLFEAIKTMFEGLSIWGWIGQISGLIGFIIILVSFQCKKKTYCLLAGLSMFLFIIESTASVASMANFSVCVMTLIRNLWMYVRLKTGKGEFDKKFIWILLGLMWIGQIIYMSVTNSFLELTSYFTPVTATILTILQNNKNYYVVKLGILIQESGALALFIICGFPFSIFRQIILVSSVIFSIIVLIIKDIRLRKKSIEYKE